MSRLWALALAIGLVGSSSAVARGGPDPLADFTALETSLLEAHSVSLRFRVTAEGAVGAELSGALSITADSVKLEASGHFASQPMELSLLAQDGTMKFGNGTTDQEAPTPPHLREALLIGFTRMGILHNLARLTGPAAPDHAEGGVAEWVTVDGFSVADGGALAFDLTVGGEPSGSATLKLRGPVPALRTQTVQFPTGEMRVREQYGGVTILENAPPVAVDLPTEFDAVLRAYEEAWIARDADGLTRLFTEDGYVLRPGRPAVFGSEEIRKAYANSGGPLVLRGYAFEQEGDVGYIIGGYATSDAELDVGKFVLALRKVGNAWKIAADIDNGNS